MPSTKELHFSRDYGLICECPFNLCDLQLSVKRNLGFHWFCISSPCDLLRKFMPLSQTVCFNLLWGVIPFICHSPKCSCEDPGNKFPNFIPFFFHHEIRWVCKNHWKTKHRVPIPPIVEGDMLRSMSVVPYLDDLHNPTLDEEDHQAHSQFDESYSAG